MKRCPDCKKIVWPWQQSYISYSPIHRWCHAKLLLKFMEMNPTCCTDLAKELITAAVERKWHE